MLAAAGCVGYGMLCAAPAYTGAVADQRAQAIGMWEQGPHGLVGAPPQQDFAASRGGTQQAAVMLGGQMPRPMARESACRLSICIPPS